MLWPVPIPAIRHSHGKLPVLGYDAWESRNIPFFGNFFIPLAGLSVMVIRRSISYLLS